MLFNDLKLKHFRDEAEEAQWWFDHQDELAEEFEKAAKEGRLGRGTVARAAAARELAGEMVSSVSRG